MSAMAKKLPRPKGTGNAIADARCRTQYKNTIDVINVPVHRPEFASDCATCLRDQLEKALRIETCGTESFVSVSDLGHIDEAWLATWVGGKLGVAMDVLGRAKVKDKDVVKHIIAFLLASSLNAKVPTACLSKLVLLDVLNNRYNKAGQRAAIANHGGTLANNTGDVDWKQGVYQFVFPEGAQQASHVVHRPTRHEVTLQFEGITREYTIHDNWSDVVAEVRRGRQRVRIREYFSPQFGPNVVVYWSGKAPDFEQMVVETVERAKGAAEKNTSIAKQVASASIATPANEKRAEATKRAREVLVARAEDISKQRCISLTT